MDIRIEGDAVSVVATALLLARPGPPAVLDLDALPLADAKQFDGKEVAALVTAATPLYTWRVDGKLVDVGGAGPGRRGVVRAPEGESTQ